MKDLLKYIVSSLILLIFIEIVFRSWFAISWKANFFTPGEVIYNYYPFTGKLRNESIEPDDGKIDILLLGASVLEPVRGDIGGKLLNYLQNKVSDSQIKIHNVSIPAHSSRDSKEKMEMLSDKSFDLIIFYHSINELRANNCPDHLFKPDYSHLRWYYELNMIKEHSELNLTVLPFCIDYGYSEIKKVLTNQTYLGREEVKEEWLNHGSKIKTARSYEENLNYIIQKGLEMDASVLAVKYIYYIPDDYHISKIHEQYMKTEIMPPVPIELWGIPENIKMGIDVQNNKIDQLVKKYSDSDVYEIDMNGLISKQKMNFNDICHFTSSGAAEFVQYLGPKVVEILNSDYFDGSR